MGKFKKIAYVVLVAIIILLSFAIYTNASRNKEEEKKQKASTEIRFVESKIVDLANKLNNIEFENYKISESEATKQESQEQTSSGGSSNGSDSSSSSQSGGIQTEQGSENSSGGTDQSGEEQGNNTSSQSGQTSESGGTSEGQEDNKKFGLKHSGVLVTDSEIDWTSIKSDVETLYSSLPNITLDLYQLNTNQQDILNFNKEYDLLTVQAKDEKKEETLAQLSKLYEYMPKFAQNTSDDELEKNLLEIKNDVLKGYSKVDSDKWEEITTDISNAINNYSKIMTNANIDSKKQYNINKGYVMLNELKNAASIKDKEVFFIKYKNLLEEMNNM